MTHSLKSDSQCSAGEKINDQQRTDMFCTEAEGALHELKLLKEHEKELIGQGYTRRQAFKAGKRREREEEHMTTFVLALLRMRASDRYNHVISNPDDPDRPRLHTSMLRWYAGGTSEQAEAALAKKGQLGEGTTRRRGIAPCCMSQPGPDHSAVRTPPRAPQRPGTPPRRHTEILSA